MTWDPAQYERFKIERSQPFYDLLGLVRSNPTMRIVDLGCGTGNLTAVLHERLGAVSTLGVDLSAEMLAKAPRAPGLRFEQGDLAQFESEQRLDLVFSNAALQWVADHAAVLQRLTAVLAPGGQLAIQMPANQDHPSHVTAVEVGAEGRFLEATGGPVEPPSILPPERYAELLDALGYEEQHVRVQVYPHRLPGAEDVVEWVKGTLLTAWQARMTAERYAEFLEAYRARLLPRLADAKPYFYAFKRLLIWARRRR